MSSAGEIPYISEGLSASAFRIIARLLSLFEGGSWSPGSSRRLFLDNLADGNPIFIKIHGL